MGTSRFGSGFVDLSDLGSKDVVRVGSQITSIETVQRIYRHRGLAGLWASYAVLTDLRVIWVGPRHSRDLLVSRITATGTRFWWAWMQDGAGVGGGGRPSGARLTCSFGSRKDAQQFLAHLNEARTQASRALMDHTGRALADRIRKLVDLNEQGVLTDSDLKRLLKEALAPYL